MGRNNLLYSEANIRKEHLREFATLLLALLPARDGGKEGGISLGYKGLQGPDTYFFFELGERWELVPSWPSGFGTSHPEPQPLSTAVCWGWSC